MRTHQLLWVCLACALCALSSRAQEAAAQADGGAVPAPQEARAGADSLPPAAEAADGGVARAEPAAAPADEEGEEEGDEVEETAAERADPSLDPEAESARAPAGPAAPGLRYTADLSDAELERRWQTAPETLGSLSIGFADSGRLVNGVQFPREGGNWQVVSPEGSWATRETIDAIVAAIREVNERFPGTPPLRINHLSRKDGGWLRPHRSHQTGRDVDLAFYYPTAQPVRARNREKVIDVARCWALVRALVTRTDLQVILVDRRIQKVLLQHARKLGEDAGWLDALFNQGRDSLVQHARKHRDHFHVRFYNPRAQELGRRVQPLLAQRPEHNLVSHRIKRGDTLGQIARKYGTTVALIQRANGMRKSFLRVGHSLNVPLRGPCTKCPLPPEVVVPPRLLPPEEQARASAARPPLQPEPGRPPPAPAEAVAPPLAPAPAPRATE